MSSYLWDRINFEGGRSSDLEEKILEIIRVHLSFKILDLEGHSLLQIREEKEEQEETTCKKEERRKKKWEESPH